MTTEKIIGRISVLLREKITGRRRSGCPWWCRNLSLLILLFGVAALLTSCSSQAYLRNPVTNKPETRIFDLKPDIVLKGVERALAAKKFKSSAQPTSRYDIRTEWLEDGSYRSMMQVQIKPSGKNRSEVTVQIHLEKKNMWQETWQPVDEIGKNAYEDFLDDVRMESYRALYDRR